MGYNNMGTFSSATGTQSSIESTGNARPGAASIGKTIRDGTFAFTVTSVQRPGRTLANRSGTTQTAQGEFVIVRVTVANVGGQAQGLTATDQIAVNDAGQRFAPSAAITSLPDAGAILSTNINPGSTVNGAPLLYDVPPGTRIASIELHDRASSTGVRVALR